jgi:Tfp pilus assembly protein PilP
MRVIPIVLLLMPLSAAAQSPAASQASPASLPAPQAGPAPQGGAPIEPQGFDYDAAGRRDPFVSLVRRGADAGRSAAASRPPGLGGLETAEVTLKGTMASRDGYVAILQGADGKTYIVRVGDRLLDGSVRAITQNALVILQQVSDPLSLEKQREVRKTIRQMNEAGSGPPRE